MSLRVLTWNLLHGRSVPSAGRDLKRDFARLLANWDWDVALLQEVPPWWPPALAAAAGADQRVVLTSRNGLLPVRRAIAIRWPDVIKSNGGGANAILVRRRQITEHRTFRLCALPERRQLHAVRLSSEVWVANFHATAHNGPAALRDGRLARDTALEWAGESSLVLGGDFNLRRRELDLAGLVHAGGHDVDHVFASGLGAVRAAEVLDRGRLSDHAPVVVTLEAT